MGIAFRASTILSAFPEKFSLLTPSSFVSSSNSKHQVMLSIVLSRKTAKKDLSSKLGLNN